MIKLLKKLFVNKYMGYILVSIPIVSLYVVMSLAAGWLKVAFVVSVCVITFAMIWFGLGLIDEKYK